jgi:hypothetical protein
MYREIQCDKLGLSGNLKKMQRMIVFMGFQNQYLYKKKNGQKD